MPETQHVSRGLPWQFRTARHFCRPLNMRDDLDLLCRWVADSSLMAALNTKPRVMSRQEMAAYVRGFDNAVRAIVGIFHTEQNTLVGLLLLDINRHHGVARVSFFMGDAASRGQGVMGEVLAALAEHAFATSGLHKLGAVVADGNVASEKALLAGGFHKEATLKGEVRAADTGKRLDQHFFARLKQNL